MMILFFLGSRDNVNKGTWFWFPYSLFYPWHSTCICQCGLAFMLSPRHPSFLLFLRQQNCHWKKLTIPFYSDILFLQSLTFVPWCIAVHSSSSSSRLCAYLRFSRSLFSLPFPSFVQQRTVESAVERCRQVLAGLRSFAKGGGGASAKVTKTSRALSSWETVPDTVVGAHSNGLPAPHKVPEGCLWNPLSLRPASKTTCAARSAQITETWDNNYAPPLGP